MEVRPGYIYKHRAAGGEYLVLAIGFNSTNDYPDKEPLVLYLSLTHNRIWVRRLEEFEECLYDGKTVASRFFLLRRASWVQRLAVWFAQLVGVLPTRHPRAFKELLQAT